VYCPAAPHDEALETSAPVAAAAGCADPQTAAACLRAKPAAAVLQAAVPLNLIVGGATTIPGKGTGFNASPNFGNAVLPFKPIDALAKGRWNGSGVLIGSNHDEAALFVAPAMIGRVQLPLSERAYEGAVGLQFRSFAPAVLNEYPEQPDDLFLTYADEVTDDSPFGCAVSTLADSFSALTKTYRYQFDDETAPTPLGGWLANLSLGAYHGSELQFLFQMTKLPGPQTAAERRLSNQMIEYWTNFVKTGDPNGRGLVDWPRYDAYTHRVLSLKPDGNGVIDNFDTEHHCAFWATAPGRPF
jgi:para-nitrobenzyl esterase